MGHFIQYYGFLSRGSFYKGALGTGSFCGTLVVGHFIKCYGSLGSGSFYKVLWVFG